MENKYVREDRQFQQRQNQMEIGDIRTTITEMKTDFDTSRLDIVQKIISELEYRLLEIYQTKMKFKVLKETPWDLPGGTVDENPPADGEFYVM